MTLEELKRLMAAAEAAQAAHTADESDSFDLLHACTQSRLDLEDSAVTALPDLIAAVEALQKILKSIPAAGECAGHDRVLVEYTNEEWFSMVEVSNASLAILSRLGVE